MARLAVGLAVVLTMLTGVGWSVAEHETDTVHIHTGVRSEEEARAYPCPVADAGGWERSGPVVCLPRVADTWQLHYEIPDGRGCSYHHATGWSGSCVFDIDMGDHIRVWGTSGIPMTTVTVDWEHGGTHEHDPIWDEEDGGAAGDGNADDGTADDGPDGPSGPDQPAPPDAPEQPSGPTAPPEPEQPTANEAPSAPQAGPGDASTEASGMARGTDRSGTVPTDASGSSQPQPSPDDTAITVSQEPGAGSTPRGRGAAIALAVLALAVSGGALVRFATRHP